MKARDLMTSDPSVATSREPIARAQSSRLMSMWASCPSSTIRRRCTSSGSSLIATSPFGHPGDRFRELDVVRVTALHGRAAEHLSIARVQRAPRLGDIGTVVQAITGASPPRYLVECNTGEGEIVWLAELTADELTLESAFKLAGR